MFGGSHVAEVVDIAGFGMLTAIVVNIGNKKANSGFQLTNNIPCVLNPPKLDLNRVMGFLSTINYVRGR